VRLYVAGESPNSVVALANLRVALGQRADPQPDLEVIDVLRDPERGLRDGITATPMLVKVAPLPERRVLGSLRDRGILLNALGLDEGAA
jgi:circadian clock protein KaiB